MDELRRRGAVDLSERQHGNVFEIVASSAGSREVSLRVKTKASGDWQTSTKLGEARHEDPNETRFWVLVDRGVAEGTAPGYFIVPDWWMRNYIHLQFESHLDAHGGRRPVSPGSTHCAVHQRHVEGWRDRWDLLGVA